MEKRRKDKGHNEAQRTHYAKLYATAKISLRPDSKDDLWEWAKWYPLTVFEGFLPTIKDKSLLSICTGAGRELGLFHKYGVKITATDLTVEHLQELAAKGIIERAEVQNAERLDYADDSFDYGFVNAGLHHLSYPHAGLSELLRTAREAVIFIEAQDSILHAITRMMGRKDADFEPSGNYVYRWKKREIEKISLSAHAHSFAIKTKFLPISMWMRGVTEHYRKTWEKIFDVANVFLSPIGNVMIAFIFKRAPSEETAQYLRDSSYLHKVLEQRYKRES